MQFKVKPATLLTFFVVALVLQIVTASAIPSEYADAGIEVEVEEPEPLAWLLAPALENNA
ncbi:hypothetical protein C8R45DRAFT_1087424 [Mycena sanguinolenta]|nr:hypothetical protein C8R45DRAFT_1087424 [Mycena sanguinolenta]